MLTMGQLAKWATDTLAANTIFTALCTSTFGSALNYYRHTPMDGRTGAIETSPFLTVYSNEMGQDFSSGAQYRRTWDIPLAIGYMYPAADEISSLDGSVHRWTPTDKVEKVAVAAIELLRKEASTCGIYGESVIMLNTRLIVTEIGEAEDIQANIFLTFGEETHI